MASSTHELSSFGDDDHFKERFHENFDAIRESLNYEELVPLLCEGTSESALVSIEEGKFLLDQSRNRHDKVILLSQKLESKSYFKLLEYLQREEWHLGHAYIRDLLEGKQHASEEDIAYSKAVKDAVLKRQKLFSEGMNFTALIPYMLECKLLTISDVKQLDNTSESKLPNLLSIIDTKGPLGYSLFAKCLQNEDSHVTHSQLYHLIHANIDSSLLPEKHWKKLMNEESTMKGVTTLTRGVPNMHGILKGEKYEQMINTFQTCQYSGDWAEMEAEASKYLGEGIPYELQIVALLEKAVGLVFHDQEQEESFSLISEAKEKCELVQGDNSTFLEGRCEYVLAILYRYTKQYDKAREHAENAQRILFIVEQGYDTAFACLTYACLLIETNGSKTTEAKNYLAAAISESGAGMCIRMAQLFIGSIHSSKDSAHDKNRSCTLRETEECLKNIEPDILSIYSRCRLCLIESNIFRFKEMRIESKAAAELGLNLATEYNFTNEIEEAKEILESLKY